MDATFRSLGYESAKKIRERDTAQSAKSTTRGADPIVD